MFDELKKKLFGSSKVEPEPEPVAKEPEPAPEPPIETEGVWHKRRREQRNARMVAKERHPPSIEEIRHDFKSAFGGVEPPTPAVSMTAEEMSLIFKNTAHGPFDLSGVNSKILEGLKASRPEMIGKMHGGIDPSFLVSADSFAGIGKTFHKGGLVAAAFGSTSAEMEEEKHRLDKMKQEQKAKQEESERAELKRLSKAFVHGIGDEMSNEFANAENRGERSEFASEVLKKLIIAASSNGLDIHELLEEIEMTDEEKTKEALALEALAGSITAYWGGVDYELSEDKFALTGPTSLTILRAPSETHKSGYGKKAHIGGEEFTGLKAYLGKRGHIICCFKPVGVEDYVNMEMPLGDCFAQLTGFQRHFVEQGFSAQYQAIRDAKNAEKQAADLEQFSEKYADFGSF